DDALNETGNRLADARHLAILHLCHGYCLFHRILEADQRPQIVQRLHDRQGLVEWDDVGLLFARAQAGGDVLCLELEALALEGHLDPLRGLVAPVESERVRTPPRAVDLDRAGGTEDRRQEWRGRLD